MIHPFDPDDMGDENHIFDGSAPPGGNSARGFDADEGTLDELALRHLMHRAVQDIAPQADALERLQRAVPARRARRRQAMVGVAAGVLLMGTAVPALLHAADSVTTDSSTTANASPSQGRGSATSVQGGTEQGGGASGPAGTANADGGPGTGWAGGARPSTSTSAVPSSAPTGATVTAPICSRAQLGDGSAQVGPPDSAGRIYGSFQVVNISNSSCSIPGEGQITVTGQGGVDASKIQVLDHTTGDPASGLPDPAAAPTSVVLVPGKAYQVQFAWIPASTGSTTGCAPSGTTGGGSTVSSGSGSVDGSSSSGSGSTTSTASTANSPLDAGSPSATPAASGITLTHTPQEGDPSAVSTTIVGACSGTVYRTAALAAP